MKLLIKRGVTSRMIDIFINDNSVVNGRGLSGLLFNTASLTAYYKRDNDATATAITLVTATLGTWTTGGFIEADSVHMRGVYQLGIPNAILASGCKTATIYLQGAANMAPATIEIQFTDLDLDDATGAGLTSVASAASLATAQTAINAIKAVTDLLPNAGALTSLATAAALATAQTAINAIKTVTDALPNAGSLSSLSTAAALATAQTAINAIKTTTDLNLDAKISTILTSVLTEAYAADGAAPTGAQLLFMIWSKLAEEVISGVTVTSKKLDGVATAMTFTLNDATNPTSITRAS